MGFIPIIIINKEELLSVKDYIKNGLYRDDFTTNAAANYLEEAMKNKEIIFGEYKLVLVQTDTSNTNIMIREILIELGIEYQVNY